MFWCVRFLRKRKTPASGRRGRDGFVDRSEKRSSWRSSIELSLAISGGVCAGDERLEARGVVCGVPVRRAQCAVRARPGSASRMRGPSSYNEVCRAREGRAEGHQIYRGLFLSLAQSRSRPAQARSMASNTLKAAACSAASWTRKTAAPRASVVRLAASVPISRLVDAGAEQIAEQALARHADQDRQGEGLRASGRSTRAP